MQVSKSISIRMVVTNTEMSEKGRAFSEGVALRAKVGFSSQSIRTSLFIRHLFVIIMFRCQQLLRFSLCCLVRNGVKIVIVIRLNRLRTFPIGLKKKMNCLVSLYLFVVYVMDGNESNYDARRNIVGVNTVEVAGNEAREARNRANRQRQREHRLREEEAVLLSIQHAAQSQPVFKTCVGQCVAAEAPCFHAVGREKRKRKKKRREKKKKKKGKEKGRGKERNSIPSELKFQVQGCKSDQRVRRAVKRQYFLFSNASHLLH